jgi:serine/threonine protein kinase
MDLSVQNVYGLLLRSRLLSPEDARAMFERWQAQAQGAPGNAGEFARWMVAQQYLTEYQATLLARGHADGFFLGQYKILDRLGKGRMAGVYKAVHRLGQVVAIKVLPPSKARDPALLARFQREARLALRLKHPNVVRAFQVGEAGGLLYLVMECLEGETLDETLRRRGPMPPGEAVRLVHQALLGLEHLHEQGLVHRDLKPANLMVVPVASLGGADTTMRSVLKILDMSLARALSDDPEAEKGEAGPLTTEGAVLGTPDYMAPEQARDAHAADVRADVYSLGCVLYHLIAGRPPFPDSNIISQMIRHATEAPRPLKEFNPAVPEGLEQIVGWMMAKDPARRYPTPERAAQALQMFLAAGAEPESSPEAAAKMATYLTWLEVGDGPAPPAAPGPAQPRPAPAAAPERAKRSKRRPRKERRPEAAPGGEPTARPAEERLSSFDVELVPVAAPGAAGLGRFVPRLTGRDCLMFGAGAGCVLAALLLGWLAARLLGH